MHLDRTARRRTFYVSVAAVATTGLLVVSQTPTASIVDTSLRTDTSAVVSEWSSNDLITLQDPPVVEAVETLSLESYLKQSGPANARAAASAPPTPVVRPKIDAYTVAPGESLGLIAQHFGLKVQTLLWANDLEADDVIKPGQELVVPSIDGVVHKVASGDTLSGIAAYYAAELDRIVDSNPDINPGALQPGDVLVVPDGQRGIRRLLATARSGGRSNTRTFEKWPASGPLTDPFGWRVHPVFGTSHYHDGLDIGAPNGSPVLAVTAGTVTMASRYGGYGLTVKIDHGAGVVTQYAHLSEWHVAVGEQVRAGQMIGNVGNTGNSTGPHLHFSVYVNGTPVDPASWLP